MRFVQIKWVFVSLLGILISACAVKPPVTSDYDTSYDFGQLKTYAWIKGAEDKVSTLDNKRQANAIETILNRKGFREVANNEEADFLLKTHTVTDKKTDVDHFYRTWGYHPYYHPNVFYPHFYGGPHNGTTIVREYRIGTLVLDIVDRKKKQVVWRGTVAKPLGIYKNRSPEERATIALSNAEHMLNSFPPGVSSTL
ncbi:DUF4136 domain-containing protein [Aliikangiella coralliicola]|uniref:DUF4136 domain-containing protein n=1 Tax=Aliikangiella coralliicola TaxID=2592383 RepID=A0A545TWB2_9GAMM|nr:DUF4136 domain-containing protein [Aliikangiella coralliicola]TQV81505.1 DUF4136 domain-containing protein [Aliikangiella coralliicola]